MSERKYQTTKEECEATIKGVCEGCGGKLEALETVNNAHQPTFWVGCNHCSCFRSGVDKMYFDIARQLVKDGTILPYNMDKCEYEKTPERLEYYYDSQTAGLSHKISFIHKLIKEYK